MSAAQNSQVVLLGASNLTRGLGHVVREVRTRIGGAPRILAALGHGRSFGRSSSVLARRLPSVLECGLWERLDRPAHALLVDIGNDLAYGERPERVLDWVRECAERLGGARLTIASLPRASLEAAPRWRLQLARALLFPTRALDLEGVLADVASLDLELERLARSLGATRVVLEREWYGFDPIHIARAAAPLAWRAVCAPFGTPGVEPARELGCAVRLALARAAEQRVAGVRLRARQPSVRWSDGAELSLF